MSEKFRDKLGYLSDELEEMNHLRSSSPHSPQSGNRSPRRTSRSPRPHKNFDSRPEIVAWPAPPPQTSVVRPIPKQSSNRNLSVDSIVQESSSLSEDSSKLLAMLRVAAASSPGPQHGRESELRRKIQNLEETVAEYERQKYNVMGTFTEYRERVAERERKLEADYSNKIIALSEEVLGAKKDFEARMKSFQALQEKFEREKEQALEKLRQEHQKEIQVLEQRFSESQLLNLEQKYIIEIQRLEEERKSLKNEKERLGETFEMKLRRAQSLYETELTSVKLLYSKELEALRDHEDALKDELAARQEEFHDRLQELQHQVQQSKDEVSNAKNEIGLLEKKLHNKDVEIQIISKELDCAKTTTNSSLRKLKDEKEKIEKLQNEYKTQEAELKEKCAAISSAESTKNKLEATIQELQVEVKALKNKVEFLEKERENLTSQSESQTQLQNSQVQALEAVLESVTKEKETTKEHYEKLLEKEREQAEEREYSMKKEFSVKLNELEEQYNALREHLEQGDTFGGDNVKLWEEIECLRSEKASLEEEVTNLKEQLVQEQQDQKNEIKEVSLDYIIELLKAVENVRKKAIRVNSSGSEKNGSGMAYEEDKILDVYVDSFKEQLRNELTDDEEERGPELMIVLNKLKELETNLDEIVQEKNQAIEKVDKLEEANKFLVEKLQKIQHDQVDKLQEEGEDAASIREQFEEQKRLFDELQEKAALNEGNFTQKLESKLKEQKKALENFYKDQMDAERIRLQKENEELSEQLKSFDQTNEEKNNEITLLEKKTDVLAEEIAKVEEELDKKNTELKNFKNQTDEYLRKREKQQALALEKKIVNLNKEHEKTIDLIRQREIDLVDELDEVKKQAKIKPEVIAMEVQTDELAKPEPEKDESRDEEIKKLKQQLENMKTALEDKNDLIEQLQQTVSFQACCTTVDCHTHSHDVNKKDRSQSVSSEHVAMHTKAANKFASIMSQMTEKKDKKGKTATEDPKPSASDKKAAKEKEKEAAKEKEKAKKEEKAEKKQSAATSRAKSPSLLTRLRERSPSKAKFGSTDPLPTSPTGSSKNFLLSPADAERPVHEEKRRSSPSRPVVSKIEKKESPPGSSNSSNSPTEKDKPEKRPAWKF